MKVNKLVLHISLVVLVCLVSYVNIIGNEFVWDDSKFILDSPETMTFERTLHEFSTDQMQLYRPMRSMFYFFAFKLFNFNPVYYHFFSILLHMGISITIYFVIYNLFSKKLALFSSILFAVHPLHTARVANITGSFDLIGILFYLLAFLFYIIYRKNNKISYLITSAGIFILGLFSSEEAYTLPLIILVYEFVFHKQRKLFHSLYYWIPLAIVAYIRFFALGIVSRSTEYQVGSLSVTILTIPKIIMRYFTLSIFPYGISPFRETTPVESFSMQFILPLLAIIALVYLTYKFRAHKQVLFFSIFFIITLAPFMNIIPLQNIFADRYAYLPSLSLIVLISSFLIWHKIPKYVFPILVILLIGFTLYNNTFWKDDFTLNSRGIELNPKSSQAHNNLGNYYFDKKDLGNAFAHFRSAIENDENNEKAWINLGVYYSVRGEYNFSIMALENAIGLNPENYIAYEKLGITFTRLNESEIAEQLFLRSIELNPNYYKAYSRLGALYGNRGDFNRSILALHTAMQINPYYAEPYYNMGVLLENAGRIDKAKEFYGLAVSLDPTNPLYLNRAG